MQNRLWKVKSRELKIDPLDGDKKIPVFIKKKAFITNTGIGYSWFFLVRQHLITQGDKYRDEGGANNPIEYRKDDSFFIGIANQHG